MKPLDIPATLIDELSRAHSVTVLTGAGISAESGIPTFRDSQTGLWARYNLQQLATPQAFMDNPGLVMDWYRWRRELILGAQPNPAHLALVSMEKHAKHFTLITQNVDGLHARAGSINTLELHGCIHMLRCSNPDCAHPAQSWPEEKLPRCPVCAAYLRPDVVWFGEMLSPVVLEAAIDSSRRCDLFCSIGTSGMVEPAASLPYEALRAGSIVVEVNPQPTALTVYARYYFPQPAGQVLPNLVEKTWSGAIPE